MEKILLIPIALAFFICLFIMEKWIKKAKQIDLLWEDVHKLDEKKVAGSGGIVVLASFVIGLLSYVAIKTFYLNVPEYLVEIFALLSCILIAGGIGLIDDLFGWHKGGLSIRTRVLLLIFAAIPLVVINAGESVMMGMDFGLFYPLLLIPLGIVGVTTTFNFLAGYNGLEASQGILILAALALVTFSTGNSWLSLILLVMLAALLAFYLFNHFPARVFPGDSLTYSVGALIAVVAILGNIEKIAAFFFIPYIIEVVLKLRGGLKKHSFGKVTEEGLSNGYEKIYGLEHIAIRILKKFKRRVKEIDVVYLINIFQLVIILIGLILFRNTIF
jgi:UDP-N-acetylglucosamine--dolichyl-phosphate N-acetylglucosaminephosphotransferase